MRNKIYRLSDKICAYIAMNAGSPTGFFRDSAGYKMLQEMSYEKQRQAALEISESIAANPVKTPSGEEQ